MSSKYYAQCCLERKRHDGSTELRIGWLEVDEILKKRYPSVTLKGDDDGPWKVVRVATPSIEETEYRKIIEGNRKTEKGLQSI